MDVRWTLKQRFVPAGSWIQCFLKYDFLILTRFVKCRILTFKDFELTNYILEFLRKHHKLAIKSCSKMKSLSSKLLFFITVDSLYHDAVSLCLEQNICSLEFFFKLIHILNLDVLLLEQIPRSDDSAIFSGLFFHLFCGFSVKGFFVYVSWIYWVSLFLFCLVFCHLCQISVSEMLP